jgi:glutamate synthase (NADPH) small chain
MAFTYDPDMKAKERMKIPRQPMPEQDPQVRNQNFKEVNLGLEEETARTEAMRCLQCNPPKCVPGCPVTIDIPAFIKLIAAGEHMLAAAKLKEDNSLPAVCGRVCPQEEQCEQLCIIGKRGNPVAVGNLERFAADWELKHSTEKPEPVSIKTRRKIAIVGGGPSGLACAGDLVKNGHEVHVFEALHDIGGVLIYGIPEFRLPKSIVSREVDNLAAAGVQFHTNIVVGKLDTIDELMEDEGFDAIFVGVGAGLPYFMNIPGENLIGVYSANEYLTRVNLMKAYNFPNADTPMLELKGKNVAVVGGGNTAMDAVRTALRLGAKNGYLLYRRSDEEMPARDEEIHHAREEGVQFLMLQAPTEYIGDENGRVTRARVIKMELGEPDDSGRRRPSPIKDSEYDLDLDAVVVAIGNGSNPLLKQTTPDMEFNKWGNIVADEATMRTSKKGVFAGGDIVTGGATVILAMGAGRVAARSIEQYLEDGKW